MSSYKNFSHSSRNDKDSDAFAGEKYISRNKINDISVDKFKGNKEKWRELCSYFRHYPDHFIDMIKPIGSKFELHFYQRVYLRIMMRYRKVFLTATRGTSKSWLQNLAFILKCIMYPGTKIFMCAPGKEQAAKISQERINEILEAFPLLKTEIKLYSQQKDYTMLIFYNGSRYDIVQMQDSSRGGRKQQMRHLLVIANENCSNCWESLRVILTTT